MINNRISLNDGWQLGWKPETVLHHWTQTFNYWTVEEGRLKGTKADGFAFIHLNTATDGDYTFETDLCLEDGWGVAGVALNYQIYRRSYHFVRFHIGSRPDVAYIFCDAPDRVFLSDIGPVIEKGRTYRFRAEVTGHHFKLFIDGEVIGEFDETDECAVGRHPGFFTSCVDFYADNVRLTAADGTVLAEEDFSDDVLKKSVPVSYDELTCDRLIPAVVPGSVQAALLDAGVIPDPYIGHNGKECLWVDNQRWIYKKAFTVPETWKGRYRRLMLEFEGVDYIGWFFVNGHRFDCHEGMFGGPELDITSLVRDGENEIAVCLLPTPAAAHDIPKPYIMNRWHFNMDIVPIGLWRGVNLCAYDAVSADEPQFITRAIRDGEADTTLSLSLHNGSDEAVDTSLTIAFSPVGGEPETVFERTAVAVPGDTRVSFDLTLPHPRLWWPNGLGEQNRYEVTVTAAGSDGSRHAFSFHTGIRTFSVEPTPNPVATEHWCLCVNGRPFFGRGSNWVPVDQMMRLDRERYEIMLRRARDCHINILRPWGGGLIETEEFYDLCDEYGIMVWQELLMACGSFAAIDRAVWTDTIVRSAKRLRNHPSLAVWCGGNECDADYPENTGLVDLMHDLLAEYDPTREFRRNCPYGGDSHSYDVNFLGKRNYTYFTRDRSAAITEFSMASPSCMNMLETVLLPEELAVFPPDVPDRMDEVYDYYHWGDGARRRHSSFSLHGSGQIINLMIPPMSDVGMPKNWPEMVTYMQTAHGMLTAFGHDVFRSRWPHTTMAMSWVFNELATSTIDWGYVDWDGMPKISYYYMKRSFENQHVGAIFEEMATLPGETFAAKIFAVNEETVPLESAVTVRLYDASLRRLATRTYRRTVPADSVITYGYFKYEIPEMKDSSLFLITDLHTPDGRLISRSTAYPRVGPHVNKSPFYPNGPWISDVKQARTSLAVTAVTCGLTDRDGRPAAAVTIVCDGDRPAMQVGLECSTAPETVTYSDNYFWMERGEERTILVSAESLPASLTLSAWNADARSVTL